MEHVFVADTNLFFECKRLEDLPWSDLGVDPIVVALVKPVMAEIDKHKNGNGRTRKRAIEISGRIREILKADKTEAVIQQSGPRVVFRLMSIVQPDPKLAQSLDYNINDDRIVGTASALINQKKFSSVSMLTDDSLAASTAQGLSIGLFLVPESWKRPQEDTTEAKRIKELERDVATYKAQEPCIVIEDASGDSAEVQVVRRVALALTAPEIDLLIGKLQEHYPMQEIFEIPKPEMQPDGSEIYFEAAENNLIIEYKTKSYPNWIENCRFIFEKLHIGQVESEGKITLSLSVTNQGTRPASRMRVAFEVLGNILLSLEENNLKFIENEDRAALSTPSLISKLPLPPVAPTYRSVIKRRPNTSKGFDLATLSHDRLGIPEIEKASHREKSLESIYRTRRDVQSILDNIHGRRAFTDIVGGQGPISDIFREHERMNKLMYRTETPITPLYETPSYIPMRLMPEKRDSESFYYERWPAKAPIARGVLTCDFFRHHRKKELCKITVLFPDEGDIAGAVRCTVEAENLTKPQSLLIKVSRKIETYSLSLIAMKMVESCRR